MKRSSLAILAYGPLGMIAWQKVFQVAHCDQGFCEGVGSAQGFGLLMFGGKRSSSDKPLRWKIGRLRSEVFQQPANLCR